MQASIVWGPPGNDIHQKLNEVLANVPQGMYIHEVQMQVDAKGILYYTVLFGEVPVS
ncbi:MAG TPA: hypothetical protein VIJ87_13115 [Pyrinomonadaceae bacterium]